MELPKERINSWEEDRQSNSNSALISSSIRLRRHWRQTGPTYQSKTQLSSRRSQSNLNEKEKIIQQNKVDIQQNESSIVRIALEVVCRLILSVTSDFFYY